mmetsp:Transcript_16772/g.31487  ORF Transcript_16772/g.31487 Transcript_16772/m.31487 type:complete len:372 (-) Transcript_16772:2906-4021(-)
MIRLHNDVKTTNVGQTEFLRAHASHIHILPGGNGVSLGGGIDSLTVLLQVHEAQGQLGIVVNIAEQNLGCLEQTFIEASLTGQIDLGHVRHRDELLQLRKLASAGKGIYELSIQGRLLDVLTSHLQVRYQLGVVIGNVSSINDFQIIRGVLGLKEGRDGIRHALGGQLGSSKLTPDLIFVHTLSEFLTTVQVTDHVHNHLNGTDIVHHFLLLVLVSRSLLGELHIDSESFLKELVFLTTGDLGNIRTIKVIKTVDVLHDLLLVSLEGSEDQQVLKIGVLGKVRSLEDNALQQLNQFTRKIILHESLDSDGHFIGILRLGQSSLHDLINEVSAARTLLSLFIETLRLQHTSPEIQVLTLHKVSGKILEQSIV